VRKVFTRLICIKSDPSRADKDDAPFGLPLGACK
jgi:hypothetical protein